MAKAIILEQYLVHWCPGCKTAHYICPRRWHWNGSADSPTLSPSVRHFIPAHGAHAEQTTCHYFIENGMIRYCTDCKHDLLGQEVQLPHIERMPHEVFRPIVE